MSIYFITGPEGSGTTALVRGLTNHPGSVKGNVTRYGHPGIYGAAGEQLLAAPLMSTRRAGAVALDDPAAAREQLRENAAVLFAAQPGCRATFFKYSTPATRPELWPVFLPLFEVPGFRVIVIWRRPLDSIYSAYRRFYRTGGHDALALLAAARSYVKAVRHIRWQLRRSPRDRCFTLTYENLVDRPQVALGALYAFTDLDYCAAERLLPGRGFSNENGKWRQGFRRAPVGRHARARTDRTAPRR